MRRLPVYLLLDTSGSMTGEPIEQVKNGMQMLVSSLRQNPHALEVAYLSVITFDTKATEVVPLTELTAFQVPQITAKGGTSLGAALTLVADSAKANVVKTTAEKKGDWRPLVFIMTDGQPTDDPADWQRALARFKQEKWGVVVGCAVNNADVNVLKEIAGEERVVKLDTADSGSMAAFFQWVSASVSVSSQLVDKGATGPGDDAMPPPPPALLV